MANRLNMAKIDAILSLHQRRWSIRRIAKELGINRGTVARHISLNGLLSKQARAPIGSAAGGPEAKQATPEEGAHDANQASMDGGAHEFKIGQAPIGSLDQENGGLRRQNWYVVLQPTDCPKTTVQVATYEHPHPGLI